MRFLRSFPLLLWLCFFSGVSRGGCSDLVAFTPIEAGIARVPYYSLYPVSEIVRPDGAIFFDPKDTFTSAIAAFDIVAENSRVLVLGSGMGLESRLIGTRAERVHGVDISPHAVTFAAEHYAKKKRVTYSVFDYLANGPGDLVAQFPGKEPPDVLVANPPYVPCISREHCASLTEGAWASMYGGPQGTRYHFEIVNYAEALGIPRFSLALGSYSSPVSVFEHIERNGYRVVALTMTPVLYGEFSKLNKDRIKALRKAGLAFTWRDPAEDVGYFVLGLSVVRAKEVPKGTVPLTRDQFLRVLTLASHSKTDQVELVTEADAGSAAIRILTGGAN